MRTKLAATAVFLVLALVVACMPEVLPPSRGPMDDVGPLDDPPTPTFTPTVVPGVYFYKSSDGAGSDCYANYYAPVPTDADVLEDTTAGDGSEGGYICNMTGALQVVEIEALGSATGWSTSLSWAEDVSNPAGLGCAVRVAGPKDSFTPVPTVIPTPGTCFGGFGGGGSTIEGQTWELNVWPFQLCGLFYYNQYIINASSSSVDFFCAPGVVESHHGWNLSLLGEATPTPEGVAPGDGLIVEILASMDITPTVAARQIDYNLHAGPGVDDEFVEVWCPTPVSCAGWGLSNGTVDYTYAQDCFCTPLKVIWCDDMRNCNMDVGFAQSGTFTLTNASNAVMDVRTYPTMATPGNSWAADHYTNPGGPWSEQVPHPGTFPTATSTPTP